jgi:hypothetical protein
LFGIVMKLSLLTSSLTLAIATLASRSAQAQITPVGGSDVSWNLDGSSYVIAGTGCQKNVDAFASKNGNDVAIVFTNFGVNLNDGNRALADRKSCAIRLPVDIARGVYISRMQQEFTFGVYKTAGSSVNLATMVTFYGFPVSPYSVTVPHGMPVYNEERTATREDRFVTNSPWYSGWCSPSRATHGFFQANLSVSAMRDNVHESVLSYIDGLDVKYDVRAETSHC